MEQKNFILAIALSLGFLLLWQVVMVPHLAPKAPVSGSAAPSDSKPEASIVPVPPPQLQAPAAPAERMASDVVLRDGMNAITLAADGGAIRQWTIKSKGEEVSLVLDPLASDRPLATFPGTAFRMSARGREAVMEGDLSKGVRLVKTLTLAETGHLHTLRLRFINTTSEAVDLKDWTIGWGPGLGTAVAELKENAAVIRGLSMAKLRTAVVKDGTPVDLGRWAGIDNRYFLAAFVPEQAMPAQVRVTGKKDQTRLALAQTTRVPARGETDVVLKLYVGPKGYTQLKTYHLGLEESVDFGWFTFLGRYLLQGLYRLERWTGNYGWAIILITLGINIALIPLTLKSMRATMAMKKMQPKIAELQKRFKNDPKRLNVEMMNLYKTSGANPLGGCLPMLLQMPVFVAFFNTLRNAYELRGTPFILWIKDLSSPDKLPGLPQVHLLPLIMGVGMFFQQRMSGSPTDPTQKQMMMIMPVMFTFMLYAMPSGLVLYWLTNSVVMMLFQYVFMKTHEEPQGIPESPIVVKR